jgi:uncharacterized membrane protein
VRRVIRTLLYALGGLLLGLLIHLVVILALPLLAQDSVVQRIAAVTPAINAPVLLADQTSGQPNPLRLDPELAYAVCRIDLSKGPGEIAATLPVSFWSVAVYDRSGAVIYSTTNRDGIGQNLDLGIFDPAQTRLLAEQKIDVGAGLLIVEAKTDDIFVLVRLHPPETAVRARYEDALRKLDCRTIKI